MGTLSTRGYFGLLARLGSHSWARTASATSAVKALSPSMNPHTSSAVGTEPAAVVTGSTYTTIIPPLFPKCR